jgi:Protein of unknown function (DUF 659)
MLIICLSLYSVLGPEKVCQLFVMGGIDVQRRPLINFIAITDGGPMFLKAVNCQEEVKDKFFISFIIKEVIDEV